MPAWGIHLRIAKKINEKLKIKDYNNFLIGNIVTDINNGYIIKDVSKIINHRETHYYVENKANIGKTIYYDIERCIEDNKDNLQNIVVIGYIVHLLADEYWNSLTYDKHGLFNNKNELIGIKLNTGADLIIDGEGRKKIKQNDFKVFVNYIYKNNLVDIPIYNEKIYEQTKGIKQIKLTKEDIKKTIDYLNKVRKGLDLEVKDYKIFTQAEMEENVDICVGYIINYLREHNINL